MALNRGFVILLACIALAGVSAALTPEDFNERMNNLKYLNDVRLASGYKPFIKPGLPPLGPSVGPEASKEIWHNLIETIKSDFANAYAAKGRGDGASEEIYYKIMMAHFEELKPHLLGDVDLEPLLNLVREEFGRNPTPTPALVENVVALGGPEPTIIIVQKNPSPTKKLIPTIPPEQLRGKSNFVYALADILWENSLLILTFIVAILIIYALYSKEEKYPDFG